jgi:hypothetical protein
VKQWRPILTYVILLVGFLASRKFWWAGLGLYAICFLYLSGFWINQLVQRWRAKRLLRIETGHCPECSYDLHGSPPPGGPLFDRCPECGYDMRTGSKQIIGRGQR